MLSVKHPELVLAAAVAVCLPMVPGLLAGSISGSTAALRFLISLLICWFLGAILSWVISTYSAQARRAEMLRVIMESERRPAIDSNPTAPDRFPDRPAGSEPAT